MRRRDQCCPPSNRSTELAQCKVHLFHDLDTMSMSMLTNYTGLQIFGTESSWHRTSHIHSIKLLNLNKVAC